MIGNTSFVMNRENECDTDSLSLLRQSYTRTYVLCVGVCISILFVDFLSIPDICLPNSVSPQYRTIKLSNNQLSTLPAGIFAGLSNITLC